MRLLACCLVSLAISQIVDAKPTKENTGKAGEKATCGYDACHPITEGVTNVHLVAHTHDDVGWLKTLDQYYYGSNTNTQRAGVQYILDSVINALLKDPTRKFIYVESAFFFRWWQEQGDQMRADVHLLVAEGRLEFTGGAWSMNDEATTHYQSIVDQFTWGLRKLNDTFGSCGRPRAGWQIDPFGHSREMANLYKAMGYDGMLLNRIDFQDKQVRVDNKQMEMIWRGSDDLGASSDLFNGVLYNHYSPPSGFCFDILCNDDPFIDDVDSPDNNVESKVKDFVQFIEQQQKAYATNNVIVTMGNDFNYQDAHVWFKNLDKLIKYVNAKEPKMTLFYSTPSCYIKAVKDANVTLPTKEDDFFPYASDDHSYWTGYFSSRPTLKYFERRGNNILQACKQLNAVTKTPENVGLEALRSALGVMQHHDAVTGTEKQHVARDYARILDQGIQNCMISTREALNKLMSSGSTERRRDIPEMSRDAPKLSLTLCDLNITQCSVSEQSKNFVVTVYNPLGHAINHPVRIPIAGGQYIVQDYDGREVLTQTVKISSNSQRQLIRDSNATEELIFNVEVLPALGYKSFFISNVGSQKQLEEQEGMVADQSMLVERTEQVDEKDFYKSKAIDEENSIGNEKLRLSVDPATGFVSELYIADKNLTIALKQELLYYDGALGNNDGSQNRSSGAYIFRPKFTTAQSISTKPANTFSKGALVEEINQRFSDWASQTIRIYKNTNHVEFEWVVGPIPVEDGVGKEVISRFTTNMETAGTFYTDSNGRQLLKRVRNQRPMWDVKIDEPVAGNYYPVTSVIAIHDAKNDLDLSILTDRAQGGSSLKDGELELMVHRRLLHDDDFGVGEALNEEDGGKGLVAKGTHYLHIGGIQYKGLVYRRQLILVKQLEPVTLFSSADDFTYAKWIVEARNEFSGLKTGLPANVHLMTVEPWKENTILIRLEHFLQKSDDPADLSKPAVVNIAEIFTDFEVLTVRETTLAGNVYLEQDDETTRGAQGVSKVTWSEDNSVPQIDETKYHSSGTKEIGKLEAFEITLGPMEIRTFILTVKF